MRWLAGAGGRRWATPKKKAGAFVPTTGALQLVFASDQKILFRVLSAPQPCFDPRMLPTDLHTLLGSPTTPVARGCVRLRLLGAECRPVTAHGSTAQGLGIKADGSTCLILDLLHIGLDVQPRGFIAASGCRSKSMSKRVETGTKHRRSVEGHGNGNDPVAGPNKGSEWVGCEEDDPTGQIKMRKTSESTTWTHKGWLVDTPNHL